MTNRLLKNTLVARSGVENGLKMLIYGAVNSAFSPCLTLTRAFFNRLLMVFRLCHSWCGGGTMADSPSFSETLDSRWRAKERFDGQAHCRIAFSIRCFRCCVRRTISARSRTMGSCHCSADPDRAGRSVRRLRALPAIRFILLWKIADSICRVWQALQFREAFESGIPDEVVPFLFGVYP